MTLNIITKIYGHFISSGIGHQSAYVQCSQDLAKDFLSAVMSPFWQNSLNSSNTVYSGVPTSW
jgi:hypothetical protein